MVTYQVGTACFCFCCIFFLSDLVNHAIMIFFQNLLSCSMHAMVNPSKITTDFKMSTCPASRTTLVLHPELHLSCTQNYTCPVPRNYTCPASRTTLVLHPELHLPCIQNYTCPASGTTLVLHQELHLSCIKNYTCPASGTTLVLH